MSFPPVQSSMRLYARCGQRLYVNAEEGERFLAAAELSRPDIRLFAHILFHTGVRLSEARAITRADIQCSETIIAIRTLKKRTSHHVREVHIPERLAQELAGQYNHLSPQQQLFPINRSTAWRWITSIMQDAYITGGQASPKGLRHGFGVRAVLSGVPLPVLQKWMGHSRLETTAIYTRIIGREERRLAEGMFRSSSAQTTASPLEVQPD